MNKMVKIGKNMVKVSNIKDLKHISQFEFQMVNKTPGIGTIVSRTVIYRAGSVEYEDIKKNLSELIAEGVNGK